MNRAQLAATLAQVASQYPEEMVGGQLRHIPRIAFHIGLALKALNSKPYAELSICDLGGGVGLFSIACAALGFKHVALVDDFNDPVHHRFGASLLELHQKYGVQVICRDLISEGLGGSLGGDIDIITTFDSMEHWHHSPRRLFREVAARLRRGGAVILSAPNCVNLRKRITVPLGIGKWSRMQDWYEVEVFRGHVREPDVGDLRYIANDMGLVDVEVFGRNWLGYYSTSPAIRLATRIMDYPLRTKASLCSNIYMVGKKT